MNSKHWEDSLLDCLIINKINEEKGVNGEEAIKDQAARSHVCIEEMDLIGMAGWITEGS